LALLQTRLDGYDCAILRDQSGKVAEEPRSSIFIRRGDRLITPKITNDILESITRETLITLLQDIYSIQVIERDIDRTELYVAEEIFLCGTGVEVVPVLSIDRHLVGQGKPGKISQAIRDTYIKVAKGQVSRYEHWLTPVPTEEAYHHN